MWFSREAARSSTAAIAAWVLGAPLWLGLVLLPAVGGPVLVLGALIGMRGIVKKSSVEQVLADRLIDWLDKDIEVRFPEGAEDQEYLLLEPSYRTANRGLTHISELRLIKGFERDAVDLLLPHVTALPVRTPINVNTASEELLNCLGGGTDPVGSALLQEIESSGPFSSRDDVLAFIQGFLNIQETMFCFFHSVDQFFDCSHCIFSKFQSGDEHLDTCLGF